MKSYDVLLVNDEIETVEADRIATDWDEGTLLAFIKNEEDGSESLVAAFPWEHIRGFKRADSEQSADQR